MPIPEKKAEYNSVNSWYAASIKPGFMGYPALDGDISCDVCVIGGGYTGLSAALELKRMGFDVALIEQKKIGWEGSGRNGGHVQRGLISGPEALAQMFPAGATKLMCDLSADGVTLIRDRIREHSIDCDWQAGHLTVTRSPGGIAALEHEAREWRDIGHDDLQILDRARTHEHVRSELYHAGLFDPGAGHFHPLNYALGLARAAHALGVRLFEDTAALKISRGPAPEVVTQHGTIRAKYILIACGASPGLDTTLARRIITATTYLIATEPLGRETTTALLPRNTAIVDNRFIMDYFRLSSDNRLLFGGTCNYSAVALPGQKQKLARNMAAVFPSLADKRIEYFWGGTIDIPVNRLPDIGRSGNVYHAQGFAGHGIVLANMAGKIIAEAIRGDSRHFDAFGHIRHFPVPGGSLLRRPAFVLGMMWYRLRDLLG